MKIAIPDNVMLAISTLEQNGFAAYAVGGCVRDSLLGLKPFDWDICTSALPEQMADCFSNFRVIPTGVKHGTLTVIIDNPLEITTFRIDGDYLDNRRPSEVLFTRSLKDDLCRRDFTVNAMALSSDGKITDLYGGREDLEAGLIRCVGDAATRFDEDALRIMRALRFAAALGFEIEEKTASAIHEKKHLLQKIATERICKEFTKFLTSDCCDILADFSDVIKVFLPQIQTDERTLAQIKSSPADSSLRLALLLSACYPQQAEEVLRKLRYDNSTVNKVAMLLDSKNIAVSAQRPAVKRLLNKYGAESTKDVLLFHLCSQAITVDEYNSAAKTADEIIACGECFTLSSLAVNGRDISSLGIFPQNKTGKVLHKLLEKVMDGEAENTREALLFIAKQLNY